MCSTCGAANAPGATFLHGDALSVELPESSFGAVVSLYMTGHVVQPPAEVTEQEIDAVAIAPHKANEQRHAPVIPVPFFNNSSNAFLKAVLGGWAVNGIFQVQSGQPITIQAARDVNRNGDAAGDRALFNTSGDPNIGSEVMGVTINASGAIQLVAVGSSPDPAVRAYVAVNPNAGYLRTGYFASELAGNSAGTVGRNTFRTKGFNSTGLVLIKNTRFGDEGRFNFQIGAEINDLFNQRPVTIRPFTTNQEISIS